MIGSLTLGNTERPSKPRHHGLTHVIDTGIPLEQIRELLEMVGGYVDIWKFGFGTAFLDPTADKKVSLLSEWSIHACVGGTLLEAAWIESKAHDLLRWAADLSFPFVEVSNGAAGMSQGQKQALIELASAEFSVIAEVGSKDPADTVSADAWAEEMAADLAAGATLGITEGRESGTVGLYRADGSVRWNVVERVVATVGLERVIFEAPRTSQQAALIRRFGPNVNLGNIAPGAVLGLEALRRGLRGDTLGTRPAKAHD